MIRSNRASPGCQTPDAKRQTVTRSRATEDTNSPSECNALAGCHTMVPCLRMIFPCSRLLVHPGVLTVHGSEWLTTGDGTPEGPASRPQAARRSLPSSTWLESPSRARNPLEPTVAHHQLPVRQERASWRCLNECDLRTPPTATAKARWWEGTKEKGRVEESK